MVSGKASYDFIIRKRNLFFTQPNAYAIFLGQCTGEITFDYSINADSIENVPASVVGIDFFYGEAYIYNSEVAALETDNVDYFDLEVSPDVLDNAIIEIRYPFTQLKGNVNVNPIDIKDLDINHANRLDYTMELVVFVLAEFMCDVTTYFDYNFNVVSTDCNDIYLSETDYFDSVLNADQVDIDDIEDIDETITFDGNLDIQKVYIYNLIFQEDRALESDLEMAPLECVNAGGGYNFGLNASFNLDSVEFVEDSYLITLHFDSQLTCNTASIANIDGFTNSINMEGELEADLVTNISMFEIVGEYQVSSILTLDIVAGYIYPEFSQEILHVDGSISSMFLMRDRYINDDEFFDLSIESFSDFTIENLLEIEI